MVNGNSTGSNQIRNLDKDPSLPPSNTRNPSPGSILPLSFLRDNAAWKRRGWRPSRRGGNLIDGCEPASPQTLVSLVCKGWEGIDTHDMIYPWKLTSQKWQASFEIDCHHFGDLVPGVVSQRGSDDNCVGSLSCWCFRQLMANKIRLRIHFSLPFRIGCCTQGCDHALDILLQESVWFHLQCSWYCIQRLSLFHDKFHVGSHHVACFESEPWQG